MTVQPGSTWVALPWMAYSPPLRVKAAPIGLAELPLGITAHQGVVAASDRGPLQPCRLVLVAVDQVVPNQTMPARPTPTGWR